MASLWPALVPLGKFVEAKGATILAEDIVAPRVELVADRGPFTVGFPGRSYAAIRQSLTLRQVHPLFRGMQGGGAGGIRFVSNMSLYNND